MKHAHQCTTVSTEMSSPQALNNNLNFFYTIEIMILVVPQYSASRIQRQTTPIPTPDRTNSQRQTPATYHVGFHQDGGLQGQLLFLLDVVGSVAQLLLHHAHRLKVRRVVEGVASQ